MQRKYFIPLFLITFALTLFACSESKKNSPQDTKQSPTEQVKPDTTFPKDVELTKTEKKEFNKFLTNFSEVFMYQFKKDALTDTAMIFFSVFHNYKNNEKIFEPGADNASVRIKEQHVAETAMKFFGKKIDKFVDAEGTKYTKGYFSVVQASGEAFVFTQITKLVDNGKNIFTAFANVYTAGSGWTGDPNGTNAEWKKTEESEGMPELTGKIKATIQKVTENGRSRYILLEYQSIK